MHSSFLCISSSVVTANFSFGSFFSNAFTIAFLFGLFISIIFTHIFNATLLKIINNKKPKNYRFTVFSFIALLSWCFSLASLNKLMHGSFLCISSSVVTANFSFGSFFRNTFTIAFLFGLFISVIFTHVFNATLLKIIKFKNNLQIHSI